MVTSPQEASTGERMGATTPPAHGASTGEGTGALMVPAGEASTGEEQGLRYCQHREPPQKKEQRRGATVLICSHLQHFLLSS